MDASSRSRSHSRFRFRFRFRSRFCVLLLATSVGPACKAKGQFTTPEPAGTQAETGSIQPTALSRRVEPGEFVEVNFVLAAGARVSAGYTTDGGRTKWNVHSHDAQDKLTIHDEGNDAKGDLVFTAPAQGMFSMLWVNEGDTSLHMEIDVSLSVGAEIHSWIPAAN